MQFFVCLILLSTILVVALSMRFDDSRNVWANYTNNDQPIVKKDVGDKSSKVLIKVKKLSQFPDLPTGCEITATTMLFNFKGVKITNTELARVIPYAPNGDMESGFWGNPFDGTGYTMYPPAWRDVFLKYVGSFQDLSSSSIKTIKQKLKAGKPVVAWISYHYQPAHCVLLTGYDKDNLIFNDPYTGEQDHLSYEVFWKKYANQGYRAMTY